MRKDEASDPELLAHYEGLIRKTAGIYVMVCEEEYDDLCQLFRLKAWRALLSFDPAKLTSVPADMDKARDRYVFSCIKNQAKDCVKRARRNWLFIEEVAPVNGSHAMRDSFESRYLMVSHDEVFGDSEDELPLIPSTLTSSEQAVVALLYLDFDNGEIAERLSMDRRKVSTTVRSIREKMADWRPSGGTAAEVPIAA